MSESNRERIFSSSRRLTYHVSSSLISFSVSSRSSSGVSNPVKMAYPFSLPPKAPGAGMYPVQNSVMVSPMFFISSFDAVG